MCLKREFIFLIVIILGQSNLRKKMGVFLQPLIDKVKLLWHEGFMTYDISTKNNFMMKIVLLLAVNGFSAHEMLSGWTTSDRLAYSYCMKKIKTFNLKYGRKTLFVDCYKQFLPMNHGFLRNTSAFWKNRVENFSPPP